MKEYLTNTLVLGMEDSGDFDKVVFLYTEKLGKVSAKAKSARKITSKLSAHLEPLNFSKIRLVHKNGFQIVDALTLKKIKASKEAILLLDFLKEMTVDLQPDKKLWSLIQKSFRDLNAGNFSYKPLLSNLGFDPRFATCQICGKANVAYFSAKEQFFICKLCVSKIPQNDIISMQ
ncbi:DNA repair protein RecO [Candidatus Wolfebacteria bacterium]|nr:DNA repair protein RecO [Candidatus Wolfebacteria bacterium]